MIYSLADPKVFDLWHAIRAVAAAKIGEVEQVAEAYLGDRSQLETVTRRELAQLLRTGGVVIVDVRPEEEHQAGHIPGAISLPVDKLDERLAELPHDAEIVAYPSRSMSSTSIKRSTRATAWSSRSTGMMTVRCLLLPIPEVQAGAGRSPSRPAPTRHRS